MATSLLSAMAKTHPIYEPLNMSSSAIELQKTDWRSRVAPGWAAVSLGGGWGPGRLCDQRLMTLQVCWVLADRRRPSPSEQGGDGLRRASRVHQLVCRGKVRTHGPVTMSARFCVSLSRLVRARYRAASRYFDDGRGALGVALALFDPVVHRHFPSGLAPGQPWHRGALNEEETQGGQGHGDHQANQ